MPDVAPSARRRFPRLTLVRRPSEGTTQPQRPPWDYVLRRFTGTWLTAMIASQWLVAGVELVHPIDVPLHQAILFCALYGPLAALPFGLTWFWRRYQADPARYARSAHPDWQWMLFLLEAFGVTAGGYFLVAALAAGRPMHALGMPWENAIPFVEESSWVYASVYWLFILPFTIVRDQYDIPTFRRVYLATAGVAWLLFLLYPVAIERPLPDLSTVSGRGVAVLFRADAGHNCFPSMHCAEAMLATLLFFRIDRRIGWTSLLVSVAIAITTLTTKQHYSVDVLAGFGMALVADRVLGRRLSVTKLGIDP